MANILIAVFGSHGDLHPMLALALGLRDCGHEVWVATTPYYQDKLDAHGLKLVPLRPWIDIDDPKVTAELMHPVKGPKALIGKHLMGGVHETYTDLKAAIQWCDVVITTPLVLVAPLLAKQFNKPWVAVTLQPMSLMSRCDPPVFPNVPYGVGVTLQKVFKKNPSGFDAAMSLGKWDVARWLKPLKSLYQKHGVDYPSHPVFEGQWSPHLNLVLFPHLMGQPQADWPQNFAQPGGLFYDHADTQKECLSDAVKDFLCKDTPPWVFTLGTAAVRSPKQFFDVVLDALTDTHERGLLLCGNTLAEALAVDQRVRNNPNIFVAGYAPYGLVFPYAKGVVHQGGMGTTLQVIRAGKPHIIVPFAFDQPDNAYRIEQCGLGKVIPLSKFTVSRLKTALDVISEKRYLASAQGAAKQLTLPDEALQLACQAIEGIL